MHPVPTGRAPWGILLGLALPSLALGGVVDSAAPTDTGDTIAVDTGIDTARDTALDPDTTDTAESGGADSAAPADTVTDSFDSVAASGRDSGGSPGSDSASPDSLDTGTVDIDLDTELVDVDPTDTDLRDTDGVDSDPGQQGGSETEGSDTAGETPETPNGLQPYTGGGCGCTVGGAPGSSVLLFTVLAGLRRRAGRV